jgi:multicomponent K+:H+ antiporter subunit G
MTEIALSAWVAVPAAVLLISGGLLTLVGSLGLLRLKSFYARMHSPTMGATLGTGCVLCASMLISSAVTHRLVIHELLIAAFLTMTAPVTAILLMRAARSRSKPEGSA